MGKGPYFLRVSVEKNWPWKAKKPLLNNLKVLLTERCNMNCIHCCVNHPANDMEAQKKELSTEAVKDILAEAAALGCLSVQFTGGEPLLRPDFEDLYLFARKLGLKIVIFTNATLLNGRVGEMLARIPPQELIEITVFGMKKESYEAVTRVPGSFATAQRGIHLLLEKKIPFVVKGVLLPPNRHEKKEFESWAATIPWMDKPPVYSLMFEQRRGKGEEKNTLIRSFRLSVDEMIQEITRDPLAYAKEVKLFIAKLVPPSGDKLFTCGAGGRGGCINPYGYLHPCITLDHPMTLYDLKRGSLREAFTEFFPRIRQMKVSNSEYLARCGFCSLKAICDQCPGRSWKEHGTLDTPVEYFCELTHAQGRYLGLLKSGEVAWEVKDWPGRVEEFKKQKSLNGLSRKPKEGPA
jgi:MoaA/NifB/PqqE/SkfB family radical SAM enzyme